MAESSRPTTWSGLAVFLETGEEKKHTLHANLDIYAKIFTYTNTPTHLQTLNSQFSKFHQANQTHPQKNRMGCCLFLSFFGALDGFHGAEGSQAGKAQRWLLRCPRPRLRWSQVNSLSQWLNFKLSGITCLVGKMVVHWLFVSEDIREWNWYLFWVEDGSLEFRVEIIMVVYPSLSIDWIIYLYNNIIQYIYNNIYIYIYTILFLNPSMMPCFN